MRIHQRNDPFSEFKVFKFSDIQAVSMKPLTLEEKTKIQERWSFEFILKTEIREFVLYATSHDERLLWMHAFKWIIELNSYDLSL